MPEVLCFVCQDTTTRVCPLCSRPFCFVHASQKDDNFCADCMNSLSDEVEKTQLKDDEGNEIDGTLLRPIGNYFVSTAKSVSEMSDSELEKFTNQYRMKVKECEQATDRFRIMQSICEMETDDRARANVRRLRSIKVSMPRIGIKKLDLKGSTKSPVSAIAEAMKKAGITPEQFKQMIEASKKGPSK